jgi:hypothetical protein
VYLYSTDFINVSGGDLELQSGAGDNISLAFKDNLDVLKGYVKFTDDIGDGNLDIFAKGPLAITGNDAISINPTGNVEINATTGALLVPRMTTTQRDALTAVDGMILYNTSTNAFNFRENGSWVTK